ncbi:MAG TPA: hypothetical protein VFM66_06410 [Agromyces sp.]|nr:hypothetical protein [Agromyces sp.]
MNQSIGRASEPTTEAGAPDARALDPEPDAKPHPDTQPDPVLRPDPAVRSRVRDVPPPVGYDAPAFTDPDATGPIVDPLDPHNPGPESGDPLDPDSHVI